MASSKARILVADDDAMVRGLMRLVLGRSGYAIEEAADGAEAVQKCLDTPYDLLLIDQNMPNLSGWEAWDQIHRSHPKLKVLMLSGDVHQPIQPPGGQVRVLPKPFDNKELVGLVGEMLADLRLSA